MIYMEFHTRPTNMPISLNGTKYMYIITTKVYMMFLYGVEFNCA
jgi:hypothetical protein